MHRVIDRGDYISDFSKEFSDNESYDSNEEYDWDDDSFFDIDTDDKDDMSECTN